MLQSEGILGYRVSTRLSSCTELDSVKNWSVDFVQNGLGKAGQKLLNTLLMGLPCNAERQEVCRSPTEKPD